MKLQAAGLSDAGLVRTSNQDAYAVLLPPNLPSTVDGLLLVADGMGGHRGGATASRTAVEAVTGYFASDPPAWDGSAAGLGLAAKAAVEAANKDIHERSLSDPELLGMGTTCTLVVLAGTSIAFAHVGDSRAYLIRHGRAQAITEDHSWVASEVRLGNLSEEEAEHHSLKNVLLRAVGAHPEVAVDIGNVALVTGDMLLLCSDGLSNLLTPTEFAEVAGRAPSPAMACSELVRIATERGAPDNVTAIVGMVTAD